MNAGRTLIVAWIIVLVLALSSSLTILRMRDIFALFLHAIAIIIRLARPGGFRSVVAESVLMRTTTGIAGEWTALTRASLRFWASLMSPFGVFETREQRGFQA